VENKAKDKRREKEALEPCYLVTLQVLRDLTILAEQKVR
jgi:hypothetical protein